MNEASPLETLEKIKDLKQSIILLMTSQPQLPPLEEYHSAKQIQVKVNNLFQMVSTHYSGQPQTQDTLKNIVEIRKQIIFLTINIGLKTIKHLKKEFDDDLMAHAETYATTLDHGFDYYTCEHVTKLKNIPVIIHEIKNELFDNYKILEEHPAWRKYYDDMDRFMPNVMRMTKNRDFIDYMEEIQNETRESYETIVENYVNSQIMKNIRQWLDSDSHFLLSPLHLTDLIKKCNYYKKVYEDIYKDIYEQYLANPRRLAYIKNAISRTLGRPRSKQPRQTTGGRHKSRKCKNGKTKNRH